MFKIDDRDIKRLEKDLKTFAKRAYPFATRNTVNSAAFESQKIGRGNIQKNMINRNRFTVQSVRVNKAGTLNVSRQVAAVGSTEDYMERQEFGGTKSSSGKHGVAIATSYAAGQEGAKPRTKLPRKANKLQNIRLKKRQSARSRRLQNLLAIKKAATSGQKYVFLDLGKTKGIFKIVGGKRNPKIKMVHDISRKNVKIKPDPWLKPAFDQAIQLMPEIYTKSLIFQLKKQNLFRG